MSRSDILRRSIEDFYSEPMNKETLIDILERKDSGISLRQIEWFITSYSRKNQTSYVSSDGKIFAVHSSYKSSLDGYSKKLFDPFCRTAKIDFTIPGTDRTVKTTLAQLNFLKWCQQKGVIDYMRQHKDSLKRTAA